MRGGGEAVAPPVPPSLSKGKIGIHIGILLIEDCTNLNIFSEIKSPLHQIKHVFVDVPKFCKNFSIQCVYQIQKSKCPPTKGQEISEGNCGVLNSSKKQ